MERLSEAFHVLVASTGPSSTIQTAYGVEQFDGLAMNAGAHDSSARMHHRFQSVIAVIKVKRKVKHCQVGKCTTPHDYYWHRSGIRIPICHGCYVMLGGKRARV